MIEAQFIFGRNIGTALAVTERAFARFVDAEIMPRFPDGLTVVDVNGQWREPRRGRLIREPGKLVLIFVRPEASLTERIEAVAAAYKRRFRQQSVVVATRETCVSF